ncbi:hypothetical protein ACWEKM_21605 [Streptomyces sp. NPDC004752]
MELAGAVPPEHPGWRVDVRRHRQGSAPGNPGDTSYLNNPGTGGGSGGIGGGYGTVNPGAYGGGFGSGSASSSGIGGSSGGAGYGSCTCSWAPAAVGSATGAVAAQLNAMTGTCPSP